MYIHATFQNEIKHLIYMDRYDGKALNEAMSKVKQSQFSYILYTVHKFYLHQGYPEFIWTFGIINVSKSDYTHIVVSCCQAIATCCLSWRS